MAQRLLVKSAVSGIKELPCGQRPRERLLELGGRALSDTELVAVIFGGSLESAAAVVRSFGGAGGLPGAGLGELCAVRGVGAARACQLKAALEIGRRAATTPLRRGLLLNNPSEVAAFLGDMGGLESEELQVLALDCRHHLRERFVAAAGSLNAVHVEPRDILRRLIREAAAAMIVAHNHPSGDPTPSQEDTELTRRLAVAGELVGIVLLDHLIIARGGFYSFANAGALPLGKQAWATCAKQVPGKKRNNGQEIGI